MKGAERVYEVAVCQFDEWRAFIVMATSERDALSKVLAARPGLDEFTRINITEKEGEII